MMETSKKLLKVPSMLFFALLALPVLVRADDDDDDDEEVRSLSF